MAKLIKRDQADPEAAASISLHEQETQVQSVAPQLSQSELQPRRGPIIDHRTFEAKNEALGIRDRAEAQAAEVVTEAEKQASALLAQAEQDAQALKEAGRAEGLQAGREEGALEYVALCVRVREDAEHSQGELAPQITKIAMAIARRVLGRELEFAPEMVVDIVKKTLGDKARQRRDITLRVHPSDAVHLREHKAALLEVLNRTQDIRIQEDAGVSPHGVIIETEAGVVDAQLETQLRAIERAIEAVT